MGTWLRYLRAAMSALLILGGYQVSCRYGAEATVSVGTDVRVAYLASRKGIGRFFRMWVRSRPVEEQVAIQAAEDGLRLSVRIASPLWSTLLPSQSAGNPPCPIPPAAVGRDPAPTF